MGTAGYDLDDLNHDLSDVLLRNTIFPFCCIIAPLLLSPKCGLIIFFVGFFLSAFSRGVAVGDLKLFLRRKNYRYDTWCTYYPLGIIVSTILLIVVYAQRGRFFFCLRLSTVDFEVYNTRQAYGIVLSSRQYIFFQYLI